MCLESFFFSRGNSVFFFFLFYLKLHICVEVVFVRVVYKQIDVTLWFLNFYCNKHKNYILPIAEFAFLALAFIYLNNTEI